MDGNQPTPSSWNPLSDILKFIVQQFERMPRWVQVLVYLLFVLVLIQEITAPTYVQGKIWVKKESSAPSISDGDSYVLRRGDTTVVANKFGRWAVRTNRKIPGKIKLQVFDDNGKALGPIDVSIPIPIYSDFVDLEPTDVTYETSTGKLYLGDPWKVGGEKK